MSNENIKKLMESSSLDDILIAFEFIKDWSLKMIEDNLIIQNKRGGLHINTKFNGTSGINDYKLNNLFIHINNGYVHIYDEKTEIIKYKQL